MRRRHIIILAGGAALLVLGAGLYKLWPRIRTYIPLPVANEPIQADGSYTNVIFLHHSTGGNLIAQGHVRELFRELGYQFWDHGYNFEGLVRPDGTRTCSNYRIPGNRGHGNTDVGGLVELFRQPVTDPPDNAFSRLLQHEVIAFKSCFPNSAIKDDAMLQQFKDWYLEMRDVFDQHPDRVFILLTSPPLHPLATNAGEAARARELANWLQSEEFLAGHPNFFVFDFFGYLADPETHMLRAEYQRDPDKSDSHPNRLANETIGPAFVEFIDQVTQIYRQGRLDNP